ncbi:O-antigen ligase family protein [Psychroserpens algicola]|uniref:O-antigen ligase family protein n=1 Tax=Psychroserpens algicola TaxID=1719034 RepID=UPI0019534886|nr:O-antigen ligase family protein [Psychroserpens algicola]
MIKRLTKDKLVNFHFFSICFLGASILLPENLRNISLFLFVILIVILALKKPVYNATLIKPLVANTSLFLILSLSLLYSSDLDLGLKRLMVIASMPVFSIGFYLINSTYTINYDNFLKKFYLIFYISTALFFVCVLIQNIFNDHLNEFIFRDYSERINSKYGKYSMHPIYASLYISISLLIATQISHYFKSIAKRILFYSSILFLVLILVMLARKGIIAITTLLFAVYFLRKKNKKVIYTYVSILIVFLAFSYFIEPIRNRYMEFINAFFNSENGTLGSTSYRLNIYKCALAKIYDNPIFGCGIGDTKGVLLSCYQEKSNIFNGLYFNSHNQFLSAWLSSGILGVLALGYMIVYNFKLAIKRRNFIYFSIIIIFLSALMTENILERQNGALLFSFFINLLAFKSLQEAPQEE